MRLAKFRGQHIAIDDIEHIEIRSKEAEGTPILLYLHSSPIPIFITEDEFDELKKFKIPLAIVEDEEE